jgi:hypothetical protein
MNKNNEVLLRIAKILTRMERDMYGKGEGPINVLFLIDEDEKDKRLNAIDAAYGLVKAFDISINIDFPHQTNLKIWFGMINEIRHYSMMILPRQNLP